MTIKREILKQYINNPALVRLLKANAEIKEMKNRLCEAKRAMHDAGISTVAISEVDIKISEYNGMSLGYSNILEDVFGITWHYLSTIYHYIGYSDMAIDQLPEDIKIGA